ncbi:TniQ family protein [Burkholderia gladioli]|uniref:TniQ family protein n=1 Tax=Burkholderia gladioli TaxID=28095 RepID=UPI00163E6B44|nr:TniQ family protein [Burkholderia gladioli]
MPQSSETRPWPVAPRPFPEEAFGSWLGRVASRYQLDIAKLWDISGLGSLPALSNAGWILFPPLQPDALTILSGLARLHEDQLAQIQTPAEWIFDRPYLPYCFRCLVLNPADVAAPRWKRAWLSPGLTECDEHRTTFERIPVGTVRRARNTDRLLALVSGYRSRRAQALFWRH